jgi:predicted nuclease of predicted toxin-antitoxin system
MPDRPLHFFLDQNIPREIAVWLRVERPDWKVSHVQDAGLMGKPDADIFRWAQANGAIIITYDEDFADARLFPLGSHHGIIRLRVWPTTVEATKEALSRLFSRVPVSELEGCLLIVDLTRIRLRRPRRNG